VIAESLAVIVVATAVIAPGSYLLRVAWRRGGIPRKVAIATLLAMLTLVVWLFAFSDASTSVEARISQFVGGWGLLFMGLGLAVIVAAALGKFRDDDAPGDSP
jgi:hypothetical protein